WNILTGDVFFSPRFKELLGYEALAFPHRFETLQSTLHAEDAQMTMDALQQHLEVGSPFDIVCHMQCSSGTLRWFRFRGEAVRNADGRARRM
ncbi:PAS domain-containing protein, partial [Proteus faecis]|uniref:PAS domain-containing protein n=1 Tax=Proteus faecis TaxID=2050967 RepID=UPI003075B252